MLNKFIFGFLGAYVTLISFVDAQDKTVNLKQISKGVYIHESFLETKDYGKVSCNGMVVISKADAIIFDTPANEPASKELIRLVTDSLHAKIIGMVINHFHEDCLGGLKVLHSQNIPSYANQRTILLAKANGYEVPQNGFDKKLNLRVGSIKVKNYYLGPAHTQDNIVSYIPSKKTLFGGCMVKAIGANKGNLADADTTQWANTIKKVKLLKPNVVIPGHGKFGGQDLLAYTQKLFAEKQGN
ncbi:subclass B1 metallo-beta-lactamase [Pedobacter sp. SD-b]|uniref:beta-lactamase n=1 Tax=Pedobacter segetis TaxID=2793069 RepID=A0ABS1BHE6_9SPHI|nr:subclass B1 metallo-beta-lactamase [Pedobacter segetis]MBK0382303.1 subclass B1 metallo-beta-lactamase [Pedobacter segetis]